MSLQSRSWIQIADNSGVKGIRIFYVYKWGLKKRGLAGYYFYGSIRKYSQLINLKRSKHRLKKGKKIRGIIVRTKQWQARQDGSHIKCWDNAGIVLKTVFTTRGSRFVGPASKNVSRPRYFSLFAAVV
jgi:large subunit ribosomal protein L14